MKSILISVGVIILIISGIYFTQTSERQEERIETIAATIFPLANLTQELVGDEVEVVQVIPSGSSPHTYQLTPRKVAQLSQVDTLYYIGHGLDDWVVEDLRQFDIRFVQVDAGIALREFEDDHEEDDHEEDVHDEDENEEDHGHEGVDPHYWLSFTNAYSIANTIAQDLKDLDFINGDNVDIRREAWQTTLMQREDMIKSLINGKDIEIITLHDGWKYFANDLGVEIVGVFENFAGREPSAQQLAELGRVVNEHDISALFSETQLASTSLESFANDNGLEIRELDPIGGAEGRDSYIDLLNYNANQIVR